MEVEEEQRDIHTEGMENEFNNVHWSNGCTEGRLRKQSFAGGNGHGLDTLCSTEIRCLADSIEISETTCKPVHFDAST